MIKVYTEVGYKKKKVVCFPSKKKGYPKQKADII